MIYIRAGLYAEGRTDYEFLLPMINRLLDELAAKMFSGAYELVETLGIDAPSGTGSTRAARIQQAVLGAIDSCEIFILHADGASDPEGVRQSQITPGMQALHSIVPHLQIHFVACIPVREIEAWLLADSRPFERVLGKARPILLPKQPEAEMDPKNSLRKILKDGDVRIPVNEVYRSFGENARFEQLRALPAFRRFEEELIEVLKSLGTAQGFRSTTSLP